MQDLHVEQPRGVYGVCGNLHMGNPRALRPIVLLEPFQRHRLLLRKNETARAHISSRPEHSVGGNADEEWERVEGVEQPFGRGETPA